MISVLVVGGAGAELAALERADPSVEVLLAHGPDDALEKLARNRRVDAILIAAGTDAGRIVAAIREDNPAHPPVFVAGGAGPEIPNTTPLAGDQPLQLLNRLKGMLEA